MNHFSQQLNMSHISQCKPLEPARPIVRKNIALKTIGAGSSKSEHDSLFEGTLPQTWRAV